MIYITGDTHIPYDINKLSTKRFPEQKNMTEEDYVIICGDFGGVWNGDNVDMYWRKWLNSKNFTTLFVDGNHENFDILKEFHQISYLGGKAHKISDKIYHLMRGEIFEIAGKKIFALGGASSHDIEYRKEGKSWWKEELPSEKELNIAMENLKKSNFDVDIIITHCAPSSIQKELKPFYKEDILTDFLNTLTQKVKYQKWFFGHYHVDKAIDDKHTAVYNSFIRV